MRNRLEEFSNYSLKEKPKSNSRPGKLECFLVMTFIVPPVIMGASILNYFAEIRAKNRAKDDTYSQNINY